MTKSLTEQFLYGQLLDGYYYINYDGAEIIMDVEKGKYYIDGQLLARIFVGDKIDRIEVLAPVPDFYEYKELVSKTEQLEKKLAIATKALKRYTYDWVNSGECARKALKEIEEVK